MSYDAVVVGAGHNGLVCAAYLARAGERVCVLERRAVLGGCCSTEELWPGFRVSPAAYVVSLFLPGIIRELDLEAAGLEILPREISSFTPLPDGRSLVMGPGRDDAGAIGAFSVADARAYPEYQAFLTRVARQVEPFMAEPPPELPPGWLSLPGDLGLWRRAWRALRELGPELPRAVELLTGAAAPILERWFESEPLKATLATDAVIGAFHPPSAPGSGYVLLHHVMGEAGGERGVWAYVRGGMGGLADALARRCRSLGVEIRRESEVASVNVEPAGASGTAGAAEGVPGAARGVTLADGSVVEADLVVSGLDASRTMLGLVGRERLPEAYLRRLDALDYSSASLKINAALDGLPAFDSGDLPLTEALGGTIHVAPSLDYIERAYDDAKWGRPSREPVLEITIPSTVDPTLAPAGQHVMGLFVQYAPYDLREEEGGAGAASAAGDASAGGRAPHGWTADRKDAFADRCFEVLERYAPGIGDLVLHRQVLAPPDLERVYGLTGGNIFQGAMSPAQLGPFRMPYRTPVEGLWLCGAATHPGGGVTGACGRNAAREMLRGRAG